MWAVVEVNLTIICACVPSLKPFAARISPKLIQGADTGDHAKADHTTADGSTADSGEPEGEMMAVLTRQRERGPQERYPTNIKLLNLLNLRPRRMLTLNNKQSIPPNIFVTTYFFLWGSSYGLVTTLRLKFGLARFGPWESQISQGVYWFGYFPVTVLVGRLVLKKLGFNTAFISALYIYAIGALLFWPASVLVSFPLTVVSNFIIGSGIGMLEATANLYLALCGPLEYSEVRLLTAQGFQGVGSTLSRVIADNVLLRDENNIAQVINVQWVYLAVALFVVMLAACFHYVPVPGAGQEDLRRLAELRSANSSRIFGRRVVFVTLGLGLWGQFFNLASNLTHESDSADYVKQILPK